jgi:hypothetical protein
MKRLMIAVLAAGALIVSAASVRASDYKGEEYRGSIFQVIGDFITGKYKVDGKPLKEKGIIQSIADETKKMQLSSMDKEKK